MSMSCNALVHFPLADYRAGSHDVYGTLITMNVTSMLLPLGTPLLVAFQWLGH